jgi:hypothetical protein
MYAREMGIMIHTVGVQTPRGVLRRAGGPGLTGCWTAFRTVSTVHQAHPLPVPRWAPLPSLPSLWPLARRPSKPQRLLSAYHSRDNESFQPGNTISGGTLVPAGMASLWPLFLARSKTWLLQTCWDTQTVIWRYFLS